MSVVELPNSAYSNPGFGSLALLPKRGTAMEWYTCREQFHNAVIRRKGDRNFLFACGNVENKAKIIKFMDEVQDTIGLANHMRLVFRETTNNAVFYVETGGWWANQNVRLSFLTALLRCGRTFEGDFKTALYSQFYTVETKPAVDRFLDGYTHYLGCGSQWHATFSNYRSKPDYAERMLVREENAKVSEEAMQEAKHIIATANENHDVLTFMLARSLDMFYKMGQENSSKDLPVHREAHVFGERIEG